MTGNPFDWTAGPFLGFYLAIAAVVFMLGFNFRSMLGEPAQATRELSVLELAYLAGGARRLGDAALLSLAAGGGATAHGAAGHRPGSASGLCSRW